MIHTDGGNDGHISGNSCCRVEPTAHAGFKHDELTALLPEVSHAKGEGDLKKCRVSLPVADKLAKFAEIPGSLLFADFIAIDPDAFLEINQMGRGEKPAAYSATTCNGINHRTCGPLAIGAGNVDDFYPGAGLSFKIPEQFAGLVQAEFDAKLLGPVKPVNCLRVGHCFGFNGPRHYASGQYANAPWIRAWCSGGFGPAWHAFCLDSQWRQSGRVPA